MSDKMTPQVVTGTIKDGGPRFKGGYSPHGGQHPASSVMADGKSHGATMANHGVARGRNSMGGTKLGTELPVEHDSGTEGAGEADY